MKNEITKICVIGAGAMGSGIAALIANSGRQVVLLDMAAPDPVNRNAILEQALTRIKNQKPPALTHSNKAQFITIGNLEDNLDLIKECDLVIEAIIENIASKQELYHKIIPYLNTNAVLASNTSTLLLSQLKTKLPHNIRTRFLILHFFNPPRYMELLELVTDSETNIDHINRTTNFIHNFLGKTIIKCNDTPGFIANRVGCFLLELVVRKAIINNLNPIIIDKLFSSLFKLPSTGIFGLYDLIGHDVMKLISTSLLANLPENDQYQNIYLPTIIIDKMAAAGLIGRKTGGGFYRLAVVNDKKIKEVINFSDLSYAQIAEANIEFSKIDELLGSNDVYGTFFNQVLAEFYTYIINLVPTVANSIHDIDLAMRLGYSWKYGPFELLFTQINNGVDWLLRQAKSMNLAISETQINQLAADYKHKISAHTSIFHNTNTIMVNESAQLIEYKHNLVFSINTKMNCLNNNVFNLLLAAIDYAEKNQQNLYLFSPTAHFSAGADLKFITDCVKNNNQNALSEFLLLGQQTMTRLKHSTINIISCAQGAALGGGCELLLHSDMIIAHTELNAGLVEVSVGLVPGWGGIKEMFLRSLGNKNKLINNIKNILTYNKSTSAEHFMEDYCISNYQIIMNKHMLLDHALTVKLPPKTANIESIIIPQINLSEELDISSYNSFQKQVLSELQHIVDLKVADENSLFLLERNIFLKFASVNIRIP
ncbi:3-hydroxyacyl-CoA dehydrogenase/enoyl-CoA hydratase family protein [Candidatus Trichorickettsia mobilis]|uniref:3-hydroxyacyl-CoA dehydrogenase/enoyl-CoA hydratase family protein n=1 Tax=Candidatus Trichorickettsia mobilis TaxID=1346319 RepID=A0ABZ0UTL5_9RICK|nr:3-hydroxyacyl-CoA dehydrogenase/enoyl-CoA hydratase family protein [Candidatus Trichorickettsia mobilis]WPY01367.1 3-hydroxyacyl-CoA dehydrogenase/enoyl-CoA hydratase family protein [Candidatus Trichorickettsia mobilis]